MEIEENLQKLEDSNIIYSRAGGGAGSILLIKAENKNAIWIWCYWEILHDGEILATADDDTTAVVGKVAVAARQLEGKKIKRIELTPPYYDLHIYLDDNYDLIINCESQPEDEDYPLNNWELMMNDNTTYCVTCDFSIIKETE